MPSHMIEKPETYFKNFVPDRDELLLSLEAEALAEQIPIIGPVMGALLYILVRATGARRVLELGTAIGYSAIWLGRACKAVDGQLITLEHSPGLITRAKSNIKKAELDSHIQIKKGHAFNLMQEMKTPFDLIFMDIDKEYYEEALNYCERLLRPNGLLVVDNTGFKDSDAFNQAICHNPQWQLINIFAFLPFHSPEKDGLCLALRL